MSLVSFVQIKNSNITEAIGNSLRLINYSLPRDARTSLLNQTYVMGKAYSIAVKIGLSKKLGIE